MTYRTDKFAVGDKVTWFDDEYATMTDGREHYGDGPFEIIKVFNRDYESYDYPDGCHSNWDSMGHTQHVRVATPSDPDSTHQYSGAFFKKVEQ